MTLVWGDSTSGSKSKKARLTGGRLFSPYVYVGLTATSTLLIQIRSPLSWADSFQSFGGHVALVTYIVTLWFSLLVTAWYLRKRNSKKNSTDVSELDMTWLRVIFAISLGFYVAKFVNIGDIPLLGEPLSRYSLTIGGFADFTARLTTPLALLYFHAFLSTDRRNLNYLFPAVGTATLHALFMQRQDLLFVILGCVMLAIARKRVKIRTAAAVAVVTMVGTYVVIGLGALARFGSARIADGIPSHTLALWVIHAELTVPYKLGDFVVSQSPMQLGGLYSFGQYFTLVGGDRIIGSEYINDRFVGAETAQSIAAPFSYALDFGQAGASFLTIVTGAILALGYRAYRSATSGPLAQVAYVMLFLSALLSIRAGVFILSPLIVYSLAAGVVVTRGGALPLMQIRALMRPAFLVILAVSLTSLLVRL